MTTDGRGAVHARRSARRVWQPESSGDADVILWDQGGVYSTDCNKNVVAYNIIPEWPDQPSATYYDYTPFGVPVGNAGSAKRFMFSSEEWFGAYGLYLYLYRAYSPVLARFLTRDPIEENGGANLYNFVGNNPVTRWDELGEHWTDYIPLIDYWACIGKCIEENDPLDALYGKFLMPLLGGGIPKRLAVPILKAAGKNEEARKVIKLLAQPKGYANTLAWKPIKIIGYCPKFCETHL